MELKTKRRTFKEVAAMAYGKGLDEGREAARKEFEEAHKLLSRHASDTMLELLQAQANLRNVSLRKLAWSRLTDLFKGNDR
jgi:hypothetical protein